MVSLEGFFRRDENILAVDDPDDQAENGSAPGHLEDELLDCPVDGVDQDVM